MQRDDALRLLRERREQLHALGVGQLFLYGSVARNEAREDSDVDLLVEPSNQKFSIRAAHSSGARRSQSVGTGNARHGSQLLGQQRAPARLNAS